MHAGAYGSDKNFGFGWSLSVCSPALPNRRAGGGMPAIASFLFLCAVVQAETLTLDQAGCAALYETNTQLQAQRTASRSTNEDVATAVSG